MNTSNYIKKLHTFFLKKSDKSYKRLPNIALYCIYCTSKIIKSRMKNKKKLKNNKMAISKIQAKQEERSLSEIEKKTHDEAKKKSSNS